jgi:ornithine cyclodeaminase
LLARPDSKIVAHLGARGTAFANIQAIARALPIEEVRICSRRPATREGLAERLENELGIRALAYDEVELAVAGADIVVEATRLERPEILIRDDMVKPGALLITYGWVMAVDPHLPTGADMLVVDDWRQCCEGGTFHTLIKDGTLTRNHLHAEIGEIADGAKPGRQNDRERIVFWHRGFAVSDIVLGDHIFREAKSRGLGQMLTLW